MKNESIDINQDSEDVFEDGLTSQQILEGFDLIRGYSEDEDAYWEDMNE